MIEFTTMFDFVDMPRIDPWIYTTPLTEPTSRLVAERNPYFWKVDTEGNQLPYIDTFVTIQNDDRESLLLQALNGEVGYVHSYINNPTNRPVLAQNRDRGDYRFVNVNATHSNETAIALNLTHQDPVLREVFQNKDFRIGLSHAVNRQEIIEIVFGGQGQPHQVAPIPGEFFYNEQLATQYTAFDLDLANEHLDRAGYPRNSDGLREGPDGEPISFVIEVPDYDGNAIDIAQLLVGYWNRVGISAAFNISSQSLFFERKGSNAHDVTLVRTPGGAGQDVLLSPRFFFPFDWESDFAVAWAYWYVGTDPEIAEEPPADVRRAMRLYDEINVTGDQAVQEANMREILQIAADQFYAIGITTPAPMYGVAKNNLRNILEPHVRSWIFPTPSPIDIEQWYFETAE
jgi:peptide/nickel transport system substrate-binding protein